jgi:hypothetical protein
MLHELSQLLLVLLNVKFFLVLSKPLMQRLLVEMTCGETKSILLIGGLNIEKLMLRRR